MSRLKAEPSKLERLIRFIEDPEDVLTMSREEIITYLQEEGIDIEAGRIELRRKMAAIKTVQGEETP